MSKKLFFVPIRSNEDAFGDESNSNLSPMTELAVNFEQR